MWLYWKKKIYNFEYEFDTRMHCMYWITFAVTIVRSLNLEQKTDVNSTNIWVLDGLLLLFWLYLIQMFVFLCLSVSVNIYC